MAAQHNGYSAVWQDVRHYLIDTTTSEEKFAKTMASTFALCIASAGFSVFLPAFGQSNHPAAATRSRVKLYMLVMLMTVEVFGLVAWYLLPSYHAAVSPHDVAIDFIVACATCFVVDISAKRPFSWPPATVYQLLAVVSRFIKLQTYYRTYNLYFTSGVLLAGVCCRLTLLSSLLWPTWLIARYLVDRASPYMSWHEELVALFNALFFGLFRTFPSDDSVLADEPNVDPHSLVETFSKFWLEALERSRHPLLPASLKTVSWFLFLGIFPRLITSAMLLAHPILLKHIIIFVGIGATDVETRWTLILSTFVIFFTAAVSGACHHLLSHQMQTRLRGALLSQVFEKIYRLSPGQAKSSAAITLISEDIPTICEHIQTYYILFNDAIYCGLGLYLMWVLAGPPSLIGIGAIFVTVFICLILQGGVSEARSNLANISRKRSENVRSALSQLPLIKMLGLRSAVIGKLFSLRDTEREADEILSKRDSIAHSADAIVDMSIPGILCLGFYFLATERALPEHVFPSLALSVHLRIALYTAMRRFLCIDQFSGALKRVEDFLIQDDFTDSRTITDLGGVAVKCVELAINPAGSEQPILRNMNFSIEKATVTTCIGPSRSGKSTFLQGLAGEANKAEGSMYVGDAKVAFCDQEPWLENVSIRDNITAGLEFDPDRYDLVLRLCLLHHDLTKLDGGDSYLTGTNGANLSAGQRHRISLARTLYSKAQTVVIDDLFSSLDPKTATSILYLLCGKENGFLRQEKRTVFFSTYLVECFDVADQVLIFDGCGRAMFRTRAKVESKFRTMLENLNSPHEVNLEEEDHKQLAAILRSRQIREVFDTQTQKPTIRRYEPFVGLCVFNSWISSSSSTYSLIAYNFFLGAMENLTEYAVSIWVASHTADMISTIGIGLLGLANAFPHIIRARYIHRTMIPKANNFDAAVLQHLFRSTLLYLGAVDQDNLLQQVDSYYKTVRVLALKMSALQFMVFHIATRCVNVISGARSSIILLPILGVFVYVLIHFNSHSRLQIHHFSSKAQRQLQQKLLEIVNGITFIRAIGRKNYSLAEAYKLVDQSQRWYCARLNGRGSLIFFSDLHTAISLTVLVFLATCDSLAFSQTGLGLSFWSSLCMSHALECLARAFSEGEIILRDAHELQDMVQSIPIEDHESGVDVPASWPERGEVSFDCVTARYSMITTTNPALHNISLVVGAGEKLAIAGRTGSGKSSLILALLGFLHYDGTIKIDGIDISTLNRDVLRSRIITLTYNPLQLRATVRQNLLPFSFQYSPSGRTLLDDETLCAVLTDLGIWGSISRQGGFDAFLPDVQLSRSEIQLFGIARAMFQRMTRGGKLILMDEATSGLDKATDRRVQGALTAAFPGCTFLIITHRQTTVRDAQKFLELEDGGIRSFRDTRQIHDAEASETQVSYNQFAESAGGGTLPENAAT